MARYIDADKLLEQLQESLESTFPMYTKEQNEWFDKGLKNAIIEVEYQPTVEVVEVKHGHWMKIGFGEYWCSVCDTNGEDILDKRGNPNWKHCLNCGAKMDGGAE